MPVAILIGFEYTFNSLTGAIIDLYQAADWCRSFNCNINIFTDIENCDENNIQYSIDHGITNQDLFSFLKQDPFINRTIITDKISLLESIMKILKPNIDNKVVIYYSGHGIKDSMVMPNKTLLSFIDFRNNILSVLNPYTELFFILDCCNPNGLHLPYKLQNNSFTLSPTKIEFVSQPILLITSSETNEKSIATKFGSVFSRHLFRILTQLNLPISPNIRKRTNGSKYVFIPTHKNRNLRRLMGNLSSSIRKMHTGYSQTVSIYSSYVIDPVLWLWIGSNKSYDLVTDITLSTFIIRQSENTNSFKVSEIPEPEINQSSQVQKIPNNIISNLYDSLSSKSSPSSKSNSLGSLGSLGNKFISPMKSQNILTRSDIINPYDNIY